MLLAIVAVPSTSFGRSAPALSEDRDAGFRELSADFVGSVQTVPSTATVPNSAPRAVVLIVPGAGNLDRDGNDSFLVKSSLYKAVAHGLAERGILSVRYRKTVFVSGGGNNGALSDLVTLKEDARLISESAAIKWSVNCVWLVGHSEGGLLSILLSSSKNVCGIILLASPGRTLAEIMKEKFQREPVMRPYRDEAIGLINLLSKGESIDYKKVPPLLSMFFNKKSDSWLRSSINIDPALEIQNCQKPTLILQGDNDIQVSVADATALKDSCHKASLTVIPNTNHFFQYNKIRSGTVSAFEYSNSKNVISNEVIDTIANFILTNSR